MSLLSPVELVQYQFDAYNAQDLDAYCSYFADDVVVADYRAKYVQVFADFPQNKACLKGRIVLGNTVIDHELVVRAPGGDTFEVAAIYTIAGGKIARVDFVK